MRHAITFKTDKFDPSMEDENLSNPYAGQSVLTWLRVNVLSSNYKCTTPDYEDWGWYMDICNVDSKYMIGATYFWESGAPEYPDQEWLVQVIKERSIIDTILGRNKMLPTDPVVAIIVNSLQGENDIENIKVEING